MIRFLIGLIIGIILGAIAVIFFTVIGPLANPLAPSIPAPGQGVVHIAVDQSYLNQQLAAVLASQPEFQGSRAQLSFQPPNIVKVTADVQVSAAGVSVKGRPTVTMQFSVQAGRIRTQVTNIGMGGFNVPSSLIQGPVNQLEQTMEAQVNRTVTGALAGTGLRVLSVSTTSNSLVVDLGE